jgi:signal transduction histidine kinase/ActR/RegA family two-component response regulator
MISILQKKLNDISISRKLYFTIAIMALLITIELCTLWFAISTLSAVRSYVGGEGLWSKAQKDAVLHLRIYAYSHDPKDYKAFKDFLKVPLGDSKARLELLKKDPNMSETWDGFLDGRNHPDDIGGMINLIRRFHKVSYLEKAFTAWTKAEAMLQRMIPISDKIHYMVIVGAPQSEIDKQLQQLTILNSAVTKLEDDFSFTLGEGARWLEGIVLKLLLTLSLTIGTTSILITVSVSNGIERGIKAIVDGARLIGQGFFSTRVKVYSRDEIGLLATSFNQMTDKLESNIQELKDTEESLKREKEKAEASEKVKQLFLANMSHEIRTPMNAILGFARLLEDTELDKEQTEFIQTIIKSGDNLLVIINDILDFSRIEAGKVTFERSPFVLDDILHSAVNIMKARACEKDIRLMYHIDDKIPDTLLGDAVRLNQILLNLISNAIKFTEYGEVSVVVNCLDESEDNIVIEFIVKDTGIGIPQDKQEKIFESFEQATNGTVRRFGGTGLGLSIVKQLVEMQDGKVYVESKPGKGSDFHFRLSFLKAKKKYVKVEKPKEKTDKPEIIPKSGNGKKVLVVEDNLVNQMLVIKVLQKQGYETDVAENGRQAINKFVKADYDIILMDLQMPEMDGYEATINIRKLKSYKKDVPIIAMTAHTIKGEYERCLGIGMNDYISKPFHPAELYEKIYALTVHDAAIE